MKNLFIKDSDEIRVDFFIASTEDDKIYVNIDKDNLDGIMKVMKIEYEIEEHYAIFKKPNFGDFVSMANSTFKADNAGVSFNPLDDRYQKLVKLIKSWSFTNKDGNIIQPSASYIKSLNPVVAEIIYSQLELEMGTLL